MNTKPVFDNAQQTIGYALKRAQHALRRRMDADLRGLDLSAAQYSVLTALKNQPGLSNADLARAAFVTPQTMQAMLVKLERAGLIERTPDTQHGRIQRTGLTQKGRQTLTHADKIVSHAESILHDAIAPISAEKMHAALIRCAEKLAHQH